MENLFTISGMSDFLWPFLIYFLIVMSILILYKVIKERKNLFPQEKIDKKKIIGPVAITTGAMLGTGSVIGVLGSSNRLAASGELHFEAIIIWILIGILVFLPVMLIEPAMAKVVNGSPSVYIKKAFNKKMGVLYAVLITLLYSFGFAGFQFSAIGSIGNTVANEYLKIDISQVDIFLMFILPIIIIVSIIIITKKHKIFIDSLSVIVGIAVILYLCILGLFFINTADYIPVYFQKAMEGFLNPVNFAVGVPLGLLVGWQRIVQVSEPGLGTKAMAAMENDNGRRVSAILMTAATLFVVLIACIGTTYVASYGMEHGTFMLPADANDRISYYLHTLDSIVGSLGAFAAAFYLFFAALSTILGSYFFLDLLLDFSINKKIIIAITLMLVAGIFAVFGFDVVLDAIDLLTLLIIFYCAIMKF